MTTFARAGALIRTAAVSQRNTEARVTTDFRARYTKASSKSRLDRRLASSHSRHIPFRINDRRWGEWSALFAAVLNRLIRMKSTFLPLLVATSAFIGSSVA